MKQKINQSFSNQSLFLSQKWLTYNKASLNDEDPFCYVQGQLENILHVLMHQISLKKQQEFKLTKNFEDQLKLKDSLIMCLSKINAQLLKENRQLKKQNQKNIKIFTRQLTKMQKRMFEEKQKCSQICKSIDDDQNILGTKSQCMYFLEQKYNSNDLSTFLKSEKNSNPISSSKNYDLFEQDNKKQEVSKEDQIDLMEEFRKNKNYKQSQQFYVKEGALLFAQRKNNVIKGSLFTNPQCKQAKNLASSLKFNVSK